MFNFPCSFWERAWVSNFTVTISQPEKGNRDSIRGFVIVLQLNPQHAGLVQEREQREEHGHFHSEHGGLSNRFHFSISL
jgi:hypothetical protein